MYDKHSTDLAACAATAALDTYEKAKELAAAVAGGAPVDCVTFRQLALGIADARAAADTLQRALDTMEARKR